jgi:hypothetical protein
MKRYLEQQEHRCASTRLIPKRFAKHSVGNVSVYNNIQIQIILTWICASSRKFCTFLYCKFCENTTWFTFPDPLTIVDSMRRLRVADTVTLTSSLPTEPVVDVLENGSAEYSVILPVVGFEDESV